MKLFNKLGLMKNSIFIGNLGFLFRVWFLLTLHWKIINKKVKKQKFKEYNLN